MKEREERDIARVKERGGVYAWNTYFIKELTMRTLSMESESVFPERDRVVPVN